MTDLLSVAIELDQADKGLLQFYDRKKEILRVVAHVGFGPEFLSLFQTVRAFDPSACGRALGLKEPIIIKDVRNEVAFNPFRAVIEKEGFRSVKAYPLIFEDGSVAGVLSTHFREPRTAQTSKVGIPDYHLVKILEHLKALASTESDLIRS